MKRKPIRYKLMLEILLGILKKELSQPKYNVLVDAMVMSYKLEVEKSGKNNGFPA